MIKQTIPQKVLSVILSLTLCMTTILLGESTAMSANSAVLLTYDDGQRGFSAGTICADPDNVADSVLHFNPESATPYIALGDSDVFVFRTELKGNWEETGGIFIRIRTVSKNAAGGSNWMNIGSFNGAEMRNKSNQRVAGFDTDGWSCVQIVYDYESEKLLYYYGADKDSLVQVGTDTLSHSTANNDPTIDVFQIGTPSSDLYFNNTFFEGMPSLYKAVNACTDTQALQSTLEQYAAIGLFQKSDREHYAADINAVYGGLLNQDFASDRQLFSKYEALVEKSITGLKIETVSLDGSLTAEQSEVLYTITNTADVETEFTAVAALYAISEDGQKTLADRSLQSISIGSLMSTELSTGKIRTEIAVENSDQAYILKSYVYSTNTVSKPYSWGEADTQFSPNSASAGNGNTLQSILADDDSASLCISANTLPGNPAAITIVSPDGTVISQESVCSTGENGTVYTDIRVPYPAKSGAYSITISSADAESVSREVTLRTDLAKPLVQNVRIEGSNAVGNTVSAAFDYYHVAGKQSGESIYRWYVSNTADGSYKPIGTEQKDLILGENLGEKYITVGVTATTYDGVAGNEMRSAPLAVLVAPRAENVQIQGAPVVGNTLIGSYRYIHMSNAEHNSVCRWVDSDTEETLGYGLTYKLLPEDAGRKIRFTVLPKTDVAPTDGTETGSSVVTVLAATEELQPPIASAVAIGEKENENTLFADYSYSQTKSVAESGSRIQWYSSTTQSGTYEKIEGETGKELKFQEQYANHYVKYTVRPCSELAVYGEEQESAPMRIGVLPSCTDLRIEGSVAEGNTVSAGYGFLPQGSDNSLVTWYLTNAYGEEKLAEGTQVTLPTGSRNKKLKLTVQSISTEFPHLGETVVCTDLPTVGFIPYAPALEGTSVTTHSYDLENGAAFGTMIKDVAPDDSENTVFRTNTASGSYMILENYGGIVSIDMKLYASFSDAMSSGSQCNLRIKDSVSGQWYSLAVMNSSKEFKYIDKKIPENQWFYIRFLMNTQKDETYMYLGSDKEHMELIRDAYSLGLDQNSRIYAIEFSVNTANFGCLYLDEMTNSCLPNLTDFAKTVQSASEFKKVLQLYDSLGLFALGEDLEGTDSEEALFSELLEKAESLDTAAQLQSCYDTLVQKHLNGARILNAVLCDSEANSISGSITGVSSVKSVTNLKNVSGAQKSFTVITALYRNSEDDSKIPISYTAKTISLQNGQITEVISEPLPTVPQSNYTVKTFIWSDLQNPTFLLTPVVYGANTAEKVENENALPQEIQIRQPEIDADSGRIHITGNSADGDGHPFILFVYAPSGELCYFDSIYSFGANGTVDECFTLKSPAQKGTYTVRVRDMQSLQCYDDTFVLNTDQSKPYAYSVKISGDTFYGATVQADYEYFQLGGIAEKDSKYIWSVSDQKDRDYTPLENTSNRLYLDKRYSGKYIRLSCTPKTASGIEGDSFTSEPIRVLMLPEVSDVKIAGTTKVGNTLSGMYRFTEPLNGNAESGSAYVWYRNGIAVSTARTYTLTRSDEGSTLCFEVTPAIAVYPFWGTAVKSASVKIEGTQSSGGGGGGSISSPVRNLQNAVVIPDNAQPDAEPSTIFSDLTGHWAKSTLEQLYQEGIIRGVSANSFQPEGSITRAEFAALINRVLSNKNKTEIYYTDVSSDAWYYEDVAAITAAKIMTGDSQAFRPNAAITREEMAAVVFKTYRYLFADTPAIGSYTEFSDFDTIAQWAQPSVIYAAGAGLICGDEAKAFHPKDNMTRAEAGVVIARILQLQKEGTNHAQ